MTSHSAFRYAGRGPAVIHPSADPAPRCLTWVIAWHRGHPPHSYITTPPPSLFDNSDIIIWFPLFQILVYSFHAIWIFVFLSLLLHFHIALKYLRNVGLIPPPSINIVTCLIFIFPRSIIDLLFNSLPTIFLKFGHSVCFKSSFHYPHSPQR